MKNATQCAKNLTALLKKLPEADPPETPDQGDPIGVLVMSSLMYGATTERAAAAYRRISDRVVDANDLRVSMAQEVVDYIGARYPAAMDRCQRLRTVLRSIYLRQHEVRLDHLQGAGKRDIKTYLESLEGMAPYVSARVMLLCFDTHAIPVDEPLRSQLIAAGAAHKDADAAEISTWLARQIKASDGVATHRRFQAWIDEFGGKEATAAKRRTVKKTAASKTAKRATTKVTATANKTAKSKSKKKTKSA